MPRTPLAAMTAASTLELVRDRKTLFFTAIFPFALLAMFLGVAALRPGTGPVDPSRFAMSTGLFVALASVSFYGVAVPIVTLRERGTLRLLSTTPVSRLTVMLAQAPARVAVTLAQVTVIAAISGALGYLPAHRLGSLLLTCLACLALLVPIGVLLGSVLPSAEAASNVLTFALLALLGLAGLFVPFDTLPEPTGTMLSWSPFGLLGGAVLHDLVGVATGRPVWLAWAAGFGTGALLMALGTIVGRWRAPR